MSEHKKKFYQVPFNNAFVGFLYILAYAMYLEFLPILYRKIVDPLARFDIAWLFYAFVLGAFGLTIIVIPLWNIADKLPLGVLSALCRCLGVIVGIPSAVLIAIPMIHLLVPYYITRFFLKITGHTAAKKAQKEKEKEKQDQEETERINRMAWEAWQYYEEAAREEARQKAIQQMRDYAKSLGFSHIPSMEEFKHARNAYLKKHHPDNGGTNEEFIQAKKDMENLEEIVKLWHAGHLYDNVESEETYDK